MTIGATDPVLLLAQAVADDIAAGRPAQFDPMTILALIELLSVVIPKLIQMLRGCRKSPEEALGEARQPGLFTRVRLNRVVRQHYPAGLDIPSDTVVRSLLKSYGELDTPAATRVFGAVRED